MSEIGIGAVFWAQVAAANDLVAITDATFSCPFFNAGQGTYMLTIGPNTSFWCKAPNYATFYGNTGTFTGAQVNLVYTGSLVWPATQTY